jgi:hypothetical protein
MTPRASHGKDPGQCTELGSDLGASRGPSKWIPGPDSPSLQRRTLSGGWTPLADSGDAQASGETSGYPGVP